MKKIFATIVFAAIIVLMLSASVFAQNMKLAVSEDSTTIVGLRTDGTINAVMNESDSFTHFTTVREIKDKLCALTDITDVACTKTKVAALRGDGTVYIADTLSDNSFSEAEGWTGIVAIECGTDHIVGLKADGTVVAIGDNSYGQCDISWNDISKIYVKNNATIGIKKDGTVVAVGEVSNYASLAGQKNVVDVFAGELATFYTLNKDKTSSFVYAEVNTVDGKLIDRSSIAKEELSKIKYEKQSMDIFGIWKLMDTGTELVDVAASRASKEFFALDSVGDIYDIKPEIIGLGNDVYGATIKKVAQNIICFETPNNGSGNDWFAIDENGQIWSDSTAFSSDDWILTNNITFNGNKVVTDVPPYAKDGRILAPMRAILEALGMTVSWDGATQTATAVSGDVTITITIGNNIAKVNGVDKLLDVPAEATNGRTFVPVRFFAEALNMQVEWDNYTKTVVINN